MGLIYWHLDDRTRRLMAEELAADLATQSVYYSRRLVPAMKKRWFDLLSEAITSADDDWLAAKLRRERLLLDHELRHTSRGSYSAKVPSDAEDMLAEGEFNRYYIRALCRRAEEDGVDVVEVFRAKHVSDPRPESQARIGALISPERLLADLRGRKGVDTALGVPAGPNSGLSIRIAARTSEQVGG